MKDPGAGSCERGYKSPVSIKVGECSKQISDY
jgi:hypothetical protein